MIEPVNNRIGIHDGILLVLRLFAGGLLVLAAITKIQAPNNLMRSMKSFELIPEAFIPLSGFLLPWMEMIVGLALVLGVFTREAGIWSTILYGIFTFAIVSVIMRNMTVQCGCFNGLLGGGTIGYHSVIRNLLLLTSSVYLIWKGGGALALEPLIFPQKNPPESSPQHEDENPPAAPAGTEA